MGMRERGIIALDGMTLPQAVRLAQILRGKVWGFKAEALLFCSHGPQCVIQTLGQYGHVFADAKVHRIPSTAAEEVAMLAGYGAHLITVHASGGLHAGKNPGMLPVVVEAYKQHGPKDGLGILPVTALTSLDDNDCFDIYGDTTDNVVEKFAGFANQSGAYGIICSANDLVSLGDRYPRLKRVTPAIRLPGADTHDQSRIATPEFAIGNGSDMLVIGRPVTSAEDPVAAIELFDQKITEAEIAKHAAESDGPPFTS